MDTVQIKETTVTQKNEVMVKETRTNPTTGRDTQLVEKPFEILLKQSLKKCMSKIKPKKPCT